jgi:hypothetical protein
VIAGFLTLTGGSSSPPTGTTFIGGNVNGESPEGKLTSSGALTTLYNFCRGFGTCVDGSAPMAGVIQAKDGNFYGTTFTGGTKAGWPAGLGDNGTVFQVTPGGTDHTVQLRQQQQLRLRVLAPCGTGAGERRELIRDDQSTRG